MTFHLNDMFFGVVYCGELIEHVFNPDKVIRDIYRVLKNGGLAIITTPNLACWYNRIAMLLGYQPFHYSATLENFDASCFPLLRKGSVSGRAHIRTMTYKAFALNPFCVGGCRVYFTAFMTVGDAV
jgi:2-polyprenyl-3-methyl-5-hydroxy-6-metoxy-1,4-benzoquinol methylase